MGASMQLLQAGQFFPGSNLDFTNPMDDVIGWPRQHGLPHTDGKIAPGTLTATQEYLNPEKVQHYMDHPDSRPIDVVRISGKDYVSDGHHRVAAALRSGTGSMPARVYRAG